MGSKINFKDFIRDCSSFILQVMMMILVVTLSDVQLHCSYDYFTTSNNLIAKVSPDCIGLIDASTF